MFGRLSQVTGIPYFRSIYILGVFLVPSTIAQLPVQQVQVTNGQEVCEDKTYCRPRGITSSELEENCRADVAAGRVDRQCEQSCAHQGTLENHNLFSTPTTESRLPNETPIFNFTEALCLGISKSNSLIAGNVDTVDALKFRSQDDVSELAAFSSEDLARLGSCVVPEGILRAETTGLWGSTITFYFKYTRSARTATGSILVAQLTAGTATSATTTISLRVAEEGQLIASCVDFVSEPTSTRALTNEWNHISFSLPRTNSTLQEATLLLYLNGEFTGSCTLPGATSVTPRVVIAPNTPIEATRYVQDFREYRTVWPERRLFEIFISGGVVAARTNHLPACYCSPDAPIYASMEECEMPGKPVIPRINPLANSVNSIFSTNRWHFQTAVSDYVEITFTFDKEYVIYGVTMNFIEMQPERMTLTATSVGGIPRTLINIQNVCSGIQEQNCLEWASSKPHDNGKRTFQWAPDNRTAEYNEDNRAREVTLKLEGLSPEVTEESLKYYSINALEFVGTCSCFGDGVCLGNRPTTVSKFVRYPFPNTSICQCDEEYKGDNCEQCSQDKPSFVEGGNCHYCDCYLPLTGPGGSCNDRGQCNCLPGVNVGLAGVRCEPYIESISPAFGPKGGGTLVTIEGLELMKFNASSPNNVGVFDFLVLDGISNDSSTEIEQRIEVPTKLNSASNNFRYLPRKLDLPLGTPPPGLPVGDFLSFEYKEEPQICQVVGRSLVMLSGGYEYEIYGKNFDSANEIYMTLAIFIEETPVLLDDEDMFIKCAIKSPTLMTCRSPDLNFNESDISRLADFARIGSILKALNTDFNEETAIRETLQATNEGDCVRSPSFDSPQAPKVTENPTTVSLVFSIEERDAFIPSVSRPNNTNEKGATVPFNTAKPLYNIVIVEDPEFLKFPGPRAVRQFAQKDVIIEIPAKFEGRRPLTELAPVGDYSVTVGGENCPILNIRDQLIICKPPQDSPRSPPDSEFRVVQGNQEYLVTVKLKNFKFSPGFLEYSPTPINETTAFIAGVTVAAFVILIVSIIGVFVWCRRRKRQKEAVGKSEGGFEMGHQNANDYHGKPGADSSNVMQTVLKEVDPEITANVNRCLIPSESIEMEGIVGKGNFGMVFRGNLRSKDSTAWKTIAVKTMRGSGDNDVRKVEAFLAEATIMIDFKHENILSLLGVCLDGDQPMVILPFMALGDMKGILKKDKVEITVGDLCHFSFQICKGMEYLARTKFVHRDLAARNIMVSDDFIVKIADFGLSKDIYERDYYRVHDKNKPLPVKWMSPESLTQGIYTSKSDVWAFGVVMWEMFTKGSNPYPGISNYEIKSYVHKGNRLDRPDDAPEQIYEIMLQTWEEHPDRRPSFTSLANQFLALLEENESVYEREYTKDIPSDYYTEVRDSHAFEYITVLEQTPPSPLPSASPTSKPPPGDNTTPAAAPSEETNNLLESGE